MGLVEGAGYVELQVRVLEIEPGVAPVRVSESQVATHNASLGVVVPAEAVGFRERARDVVVPVTFGRAMGNLNQALAKAAPAELERGARVGAASGRNQVDGAAKGGSAVFNRIGAPVNLHVGGEPGLQRADHIGAIRKIDGEAITQQPDTAGLWVALDAGAPDVEPGLVIAAKEFLDHHPGLQRQCIGQGILLPVAFGHVDDVHATRGAAQ